MLHVGLLLISDRSNVDNVLASGMLRRKILVSHSGLSVICCNGVTSMFYCPWLTILHASFSKTRSG